MNHIWFYWDGGISDNRMRILKDSVYSTRVFNPNHHITIISNSLKQEQFDSKYDIEVRNWDESIFDNTPIDKDTIQTYSKAHRRDFSDLLRLVLLYKYGGSYIDTDDLCIKPLSDTKNIVCRSYDPHTCFYNGLNDEDCVTGKIREIEGYDNIPMFPRNDCWQNWDKEHPFIYDILTNDKFQNSNKVVSICDDFSWQSISNETCIKRLDTHGIDWNFRLTLIYLFEDFVAGCSSWDRCDNGGEMCDIWKRLPNVNDYKWGEYKCDKDTASALYKEICDKYPNVSHLWLHSKDMKAEWLEDINDETYSISTWILNEVRSKINNW